MTLGEGMHRLVTALSIIGALGLCGAQHASAADPAAKASSRNEGAASRHWTGWYGGVAGGVGWGEAEQTDDIPFTSGRYNTNGGLIGVTLGHNWHSGRAIFGLETDLSGAWISGSIVGTDPVQGTCGGTVPNCESMINALGTLRGRIGYAWGRVMPYVTGGLAYANVHGKEGDVPANQAAGSGSEWLPGWTAGGGVEGMLAPHWSAKLEYLHVDFGKHDLFTDTFPNGSQRIEQSRQTTNIVRIGVNYWF